MLRKTAPKSVRENLARAKSSVRQGSIEKAILCTISAIKSYHPETLLGPARFETEVVLEELIAEFNRSPRIISFFHSQKIHSLVYVRYLRGEEHELVDRLETILHGLEQENIHNEELKRCESEEQKQELLKKGLACMERGQLPRGKSYLRRVVDDWGREEGVMTFVGLTMLEYELFFEAAEVLHDALKRFPTESKAWAGAIKAYKQLKEYEVAERLYIQAMKQFGRHPITLLNLAKLYVEWGEKDKAYDYAKLALEKDPSLREAEELLKAVEKRILTR
ncbi:tetratricopeptide repeat protein [Oleidesulfovibrio sp.]|uniref:tetratricopeptide repeat protein n=1 Tax=Oleidesulfovibrio sp. TaxID=2909707 RepID=UPI003A850647